MTLFKPASKKQQKLRLLLEGASGSGKTYSALIIAQTLAEKLNKKIAFIDTEFGSASLYADRFEFDTLELTPPFTPEKYIEAINTASRAEDYGVLVIDSISHEWSGQGGCLDIQSALGGTFNDWKKVTPRHQKFINSILEANIHIIGCARTKSDYVMEEGINKNGKATTKPVKVGTKTEQREGLEFEFTTIFRLNQNHVASVSKDRTSLFENEDAVITSDTGEKLFKWLNEGEEIPRENPIPQETPTNLDADLDLLQGLYETVSTKSAETYYKAHKEQVYNPERFKAEYAKHYSKLKKAGQ
ncbi:MAG: ATP-binding protein [Candidatus Gastranaerophilales bacterium]|nr:ATP-binding protein [Candidatus Gastranaerophilales bacterium]MCM1072237.1 ATP-binding protein [Bacteroides sp.]